MHPTDWNGDVLLVSPHFDDLALSCEAWLGRPTGVDVLTVFCGRPSPPQSTAWDRAAGFHDSDQALTDRRREDDEAFRDTPHRRHFLDLIDSQYLSRPRTARDRATLCSWIDSWIARAVDPLVVIPVGAGLRPPSWAGRHPALGRLAVRLERRLRYLVRAIPRYRLVTGRPPHADHVWMSDTITAHLHRTSVRLGLYAEVPYHRGGNGRRALAALRRRHGWGRPIRRTVMIDRSSKAARVAAYASQVVLTSDPGPRLDDPHGLEPAETYWFLTPRRSSTAPHPQNRWKS